MEDEVYSAIDTDDDIDEIEDDEEEPSLTYRLDLDAGRIVGKVDGLEAVNQAIIKAIMTPRFKCLIYSDQYGSEIEDTIIRGGASDSYLNAVIEGFVKDALAPDSRILNIYDFAITKDDDEAWIFFKVDTIYGETEIGENINV